MRKTPRYTRYLDTETTGLFNAELVELALLDGRGRPLINTLLRPVRATSWPEAEAIHGISPEMVKDAPTLEDIVPELVRHLTGNHLVVYNLGFDFAFLPEPVRRAPVKRSCAMEAFAEHYGDWNDYHQSYRWQKLGVAARYVEHAWTGKAHRAFADAHACRSVWRYLRAQQKAEKARRAAIAPEVESA